MGSPDEIVLQDPCPRCGSSDGLRVQIEFTRGVGRLNKLEVGAILRQGVGLRANSFVISESLAFGFAQCRQCDFEGFAIVEARNGRIASVRLWGESLPGVLNDDSVDPIDTHDDPSRPPFQPRILQECRNVLSQCDGLHADEQRLCLRRLAPALTPWNAGLISRGCLVVALWNAEDARSLAYYLRFARRRRHGSLELGGYAVALSEWFETNEDIRRSIGYTGPVRESVVMVLRDSKGGVDWEGEGAAVIEELLRRDW